MHLTICNNAELFELPEEIDRKNFPEITAQNKPAFCGYHDTDIRPPREKDCRAVLEVRLASCDLLLIYENVQDFRRDESLAEAEKRGDTVQFLDHSLRRKGGMLQYTLQTTAGEAQFCFAGARTECKNVRSAAEYICTAARQSRKMLGEVPDEVKKYVCPFKDEKDGAYYPDPADFFFPFFCEKAELKLLSNEDEAFYFALRLYLSFTESEMEGESEDKSGRRLKVGGYQRYFRENEYDLFPFLQTYAPLWADEYTKAREVYARDDMPALAALTIRHLAGNYFAHGGAAALAYEDVLHLGEFAKTPQGEKAQEYADRYGCEFARALCTFAEEIYN